MNLFLDWGLPRCYVLGHLEGDNNSIDTTVKDSTREGGEKVMRLLFLD